MGIGEKQACRRRGIGGATEHSGGEEEGEEADGRRGGTARARGAFSPGSSLRSETMARRGDLRSLTRVFHVHNYFILPV